MKIADLDLSNRAKSALRRFLTARGEPETLESVLSHTDEELTSIRWFGETSLARLKDQVESMAGQAPEPEKVYRLEPVANKPDPQQEAAEWTPRREIRASSLNLGVVCPGSVFLAQRAKDQHHDHDNVYTSTGTIGHKYMELWISEGPDVADAYVDGLGDSAREIAASARALAEWFEEEKLTPHPTVESARSAGADIHVEHAVRYPVGDRGVVLTGTADVVYVDGADGVVIDWKFYNRPDMLPPIVEDMQMIAYAVGMALEFNLSRVTVHRVLGYHLRAETMVLDDESIRMGREVLGEEVDEMWDGRFSVNPGVQCSTCFQSDTCPATKHMFEHVETGELGSYSGGPFETEEEVLHFLLGVPSVEARIKEGKNEAKKFVQATGKKIVDPVTGKEWGEHTIYSDVVSDAPAAIGRLAAVSSVEEAMKIIRVTKSGIEGNLKGLGFKPAERREFFDDLRDMGAFTKSEKSRWEWKKPRD